MFFCVYKFIIYYMLYDMKQKKEERQDKFPYIDGENEISMWKTRQGFSRIRL